jgi:hypothetical protein
MHEGEWKMIDITFDDADDVLRHAYFLSPRDGIEGDHIPVKYDLTYIGSKEADPAF